MKARLATMVDEARQRAREIVQTATQQANDLKQRIIGDAANDAAKAEDALRIA